MERATSNKEPKVATIIAAYNAQEYIHSSVSSALEQTYPNIEIIVVNDGSTDNTSEILDRFGERIRVLDQENSGPGPSRDAGIANTDAEFIAFLDADDIWLPEKIHKQMLIMKQHPDVVFVGSSPWRIDSAGNRIKKDPDPPFIPDRPVDLHRPLLTLGNLRGLGPSGCLIRRSAYEEAGGFKDVFAEDYELWIRISALGKFFLISEPLYYYRVHKGSLTHSDVTREFRCEIDILNMHRDKYNFFSRNRRLSLIHYKWADSLVYRNEPGALRRLLLCLRHNPGNHRAYALIFKYIAKKLLFGYSNR